MKIRLVHVLTAAALTLVAGIAAVVPASAATVREFEGRVTSIDRSERSFRLSGERGVFRVHITSSTRWERVSWSSLRVGSAKIEATVRRSNGRWVASKVERSGSRSSDNRSSDDSPGDDSRGRGRGSDDTHADDSR
ncbi:MAG: hypothetical protein QOC64_2124 [Solirubrobacteraceae bacterium]|jgi:hypothetical protein|nr:hypothetical protein [Solirubrobacteraceae bacterium]